MPKIPDINYAIPPIGTILEFADANALPELFLRCDGATLLQASYPSLYAVIGTEYNVGGEDPDEFSLPTSPDHIIKYGGA